MARFCVLAQAGEHLVDKINRVLDCVERPVGTLKARIPQTPESERAIVELFHAIGRGL